MADAVPISDVLCEAMEYLSKLGSNLRVRSENLKEKRIRKDKLRNVHAVQKAASKVLLICELSKKSIENVETGVKKVLKRIDLSQHPTSSDGGNSTYKSPKQSKVASYNFIEHNSLKLRIRKKVNMKHYTSVKVFARKMPCSMQDKYPVFFDCKLYRSRSAKSKELNGNFSDEVDKPESLKRKHNSDRIDSDQLGGIECSKDETIERPKNGLMETDIIDENISKSKKALSKCAERISEKEIALSVNDKKIDSGQDHESSGQPKNELNISEDMTNVKNTQSNKKSASNTEQGIEDTQRTTVELSEKDLENEPKKNSNNKSPQKPEQQKHSSVISKVDSKDTSKISTPVKSNKFRHIRVNNDSSDSDDSKQLSKINNEKSKSVIDSKDSDVTEENRNNKPKSQVNTENIKLVRYLKDSDEIRKDKQTDQTENLNKKKEDIGSGNINEGSTQNENTDNNNLKASKNTEPPSAIPKKNIRKTSICENIVELKDSSDEEINNKSNSAEDVENANESESEKLNCKDKGNNSIIDNKKENCNKNDASEKEMEKGSDQDTKSRPFIRCVSLEKLIKKNAEIPKTKNLENEKDSPIKSENKMFSAKHEKLPTKHKDKKRRKHSKRTSSSEESSKENEEECWIQKRKEVKRFKPKNFIINVKRLPELSEKYLCELNLRRITQNGSVICEAVQKLEEMNDKQLQKSDTPDVTTAKTALLCDSDSDKSRDLVNTPRKVKRALLKDSDSENGVNPLSPDPKTNKKLKSDNEKQNSASDKEERNNKTPEPDPGKRAKNDELKSSLLKDSTDENHITPSKKITRNISTPPSKRKHIMESMHAKKMLLTYSSSSDTEDEQLKNAFKEIRDSLLKERSSDESKEKETQDNVKSSSDSEQSTIQPKKMKKCDTNKESSSENENNSKGKAVSEDALAKETNSQVDENSEEKSNGSYQKVRRK